MAAPPSSTTIDVLAGFCRRELAAVESYRQCLSSLEPSAEASVLARCLRSHEQRAEFLKSRIRALCAEPPSNGGMLGTIVRLLESAAAAISLRVAIAALQEEEDRLMRHYRAHLLAADAESQQLLREQVIPAQLETQGLIDGLRHREQTAAPSH